MQKWEYETITVKREHKVGIISNTITDWKPTINIQQLGEEGWELVSVVPISDYLGDASGFTHQLKYIFKRLKG